jgi:hypothetical protein
MKNTLFSMAAQGIRLNLGMASGSISLGVPGYPTISLHVFLVGGMILPRSFAADPKTRDTGQGGCVVGELAGSNFRLTRAG